MPMENISESQIDMVIATHNLGKMNEMWKMLSETTYNPLSLDDVQINEEVEETGVTFRENAILKAKTYVK